MVGSTTASGGSSSPTSQSGPMESPGDGPVFNHEQCLFCNKFFGNFDSNVGHMRTAHGLFIPDKEHLIVDLETLFSYLNLVIAGYNECICCGTRRNTTLAVQQHMLGKGHCRFDIAGEDSEYADFYDLSGSEAESGEEEDADDPSVPKKRRMENLAVQPDENSLRLPSGRIISNRSQPQTNTRRQPLKPRSPGIAGEPEPLEGESSTSKDTQPPAPSAPATRSGNPGLALTRSEEQENKFAKQLATLSTNDQKSLAHLPLSEQRAVLATQQKQAEKARRIERRYQSRVEGLGNRTLMEHFVKDAADKRTLWK